MNQFKIFAPTMIASRESDGTMRIEGVASSTIRDHHGDQLTKRALEKMAGSARGLTIFLNHEYRVPEDVFGTVDRVKLSRSGVFDEKTGEEVYDLRFGIVVQKANPRAVQAFEQMEGGEGKVPTKLGLSIGAMVPEGGAKFDKSNGGRYIVDDVDLVETSLVSMPANPRSWVDYAVKSIAGAFPQALTKTRQQLAEVMEAEGVVVVDSIDEDELVAPPEAPDLSPSVETEHEGTGEAMEAIEAPADGTAVEITGSDDPDAPEAEAITEDDPSAQAEPVEKTRVTVWDGDKTVEIDTGRSRAKTEDHSAQDDPENAGGPKAGSTTKAVSVPDELALVSHIVKGDELVLNLRGQILAKQAENDSLREERDAAMTAADLAIDGTQLLINQLLDSPMGRKAVLTEASEQLATLRDDVYSPEVQHLMKKKG